MAACWSRGARSEVPETLVPTVPEKSSIFNATPYSVTEVPSTGISPVAEAAACKAEEALAMMRSTPLETKVLAMVAQVAGSLAAYSRSKVTLSPNASFNASWNPWVAWSSASWGVSCTIPMV